ncbi:MULTISPECIES: hypothetical protein [Methanobacterium]|uniref:hypothetical protein n=1 Tax=Methanobacterium TaxID=2160 RepID=UPI0015B37FB4|nr:MULTISPECIES: hypothetical protein [Methanobacterium]
MKYYDNHAPRKDVVFVIYVYGARNGLKFAVILDRFDPLVESLKNSFDLIS